MIMSYDVNKKNRQKKIFKKKTTVNLTSIIFLHLYPTTFFFPELNLFTFFLLKIQLN